MRVRPKKPLVEGHALFTLAEHCAVAVHHRVLDPEKAESKPFVRWFRRLFLGGASATSSS